MAPRKQCFPFTPMKDHKNKMNETISYNCFDINIQKPSTIATKFVFAVVNRLGP